VNVLDSSTVLAAFFEEPAGAEAEAFFDRALISSVNLAEVLQKMADRGLSVAEVMELIHEAEIGVVALDARLALETAELWPLTKAKGLSLADRSCVALARAVNGMAVTADRAWADLDIPGVTVHVLSR
jgi:ribonuclease VapC